MVTSDEKNFLFNYFKHFFYQSDKRHIEEIFNKIEDDATRKKREKLLLKAEKNATKKARKMIAVLKKHENSDMSSSNMSALEKFALDIQKDISTPE